MKPGRGTAPRSGRALAILGLGLALAVLLAPQTQAVRPSEQARREARRFGLNKASPRQRRAPSENARRAFSDFNRRQGRRWLMRFNPRTGAPSALVEGRTAPRPGTPEQVSAAFLSEARETLGLDPESLVLEKQSSGAGHRHLLYRQTYRGLPVEFARVKVHLDDKGAVIGAHSSFEPGLDLGISPSLPAARAAESVRQDAGASPSSEASLVIFPNERSGRAHLAWKLTARGAQGLWRYYLDAHTGEILFRYNGLRFQACPAVCLASGTVQGLVFDIDPTLTPEAARPFNHQRVYVVDGSTFALTTRHPACGEGFYCSGTKGKVFTQFQGPFVNVSNSRGPSAHHDNGSGVWSTVATLVSTPHPYPNSVVLTSTINISVLAPTAVKFLPVFSSFDVGRVTGGQFGEAADITDDDQVAIIDSFGFPVASYVGNRGAFRGAAVPGTLMRIRLKSNATDPHAGYDVALSSYLSLNNPTEFGPTGSFTWTPSAHTNEGLRSEINLFYHLNQMHDFFMNDVNRSSAAFIGLPVNAVALAGPSFENAFYDPDFDNLFFGDLAAAAPSDLFTSDATVPRHEYTHYVVEKIFSPQNFGQAGAVSEAVADYFSATSLNHSAIGTFVIQSLGGSGALRELDCPTKTSCRVLSNLNWAGEIHDDSIYLSQAFWDIRKDRVAAQGLTNGRSCADGLIFQSLLHFPESFQEYLDAMRKVDSLGAVPACGLGVCGGVAANCAQSVINTKFAAHGLPTGAGANDPSDSGGLRNDGFMSATDISTRGAISATIFPASDLDFYSFGAGPGPIEAVLSLPADGPFFKGYALTLYDRSHKVVAQAEPPFNGINTDSGFCIDSDCTTTQSKVVLRFENPSANQFYLQVAGGPTVQGDSNSGVNSTLPYGLTVSYPQAGALAGSIVTAQFDNDVLSFSVKVTTWPQVQTYNFAFAQLRDQSFGVVPNTRTQTPASALDFMTLVSSANGLGTITGRLRILPGFGGRFPSLGTVHLEVFGYSVTGSTISLGLSQPLNLTTNRTGLTAFNNILNPLRGGKATVKYEIQSPGHVTLKLYTLTGNLVLTLLDQDMPAGKGSVDWFGQNLNGTVVASGVYIVHLSAPGTSKTQKIVVVK